jgi:hypothetical protein
VISLGDPPGATRPGWRELTVIDDRPPGWYRDPDNARQHRYWTGETWIVAQAGHAELLEVAEQQ